MALFIVITTVLLSVYLARSMAVDETVCPQGTMFRPGTHGEPSRCEPCPVGTYNHKRHHRRTTCKSCTPFDSFDPYYTISRECTKDHNTVIKCIDGFYLIKSDHETPCLMCANCSLLGMFEAQACSHHQNAVCCPQKGMVVLNGECTQPSSGVLEPRILGHEHSGVLESYTSPLKDRKTGDFDEHLANRIHLLSVRGSNNSP